MLDVLDLPSWRDSLTTNKFLFFLMGIEFVALWLAFTNIGQANTQLGFVLNIYMTLLILALIAFLVDYLSPQNPFLSFNGFGEDFGPLIVALTVGAIGAFIVKFAGFTLTSFSPIDTEMVALSGLTSALIVRYIAPFGEELAFAGALEPTLVIHLGETMGRLVNAVFFALGHFLVYGGSFEELAVAFLFRIGVSLGNSLFQSFGFGLGAHFVFNGL
ncbi:MAG: CPBP family glutamic-type intramembrane protease [Candidatus Paceibacterota bacterium]